MKIYYQESDQLVRIILELLLQHDPEPRRLILLLEQRQLGQEPVCLVPTLASVGSPSCRQKNLLSSARIRSRQSKSSQTNCTFVCIDIIHELDQHLGDCVVSHVAGQLTRVPRGASLRPLTAQVVVVHIPGLVTKQTLIIHRNGMC